MNKEFGRSSYYFETDDEMPDFLEERPDFSSVKKVTGEQYYYEMFDEEFAEAKAILKKIEEEERKSHDSLKREINFQKERERVKDQNRSERLYGFGGPEIQAQCKSAEDLGREQRKEVQLSAVPASTPTYVHYKSAEELVMEKARSSENVLFSTSGCHARCSRCLESMDGNPSEKMGGVISECEVSLV